MGRADLFSVPLLMLLIPLLAGCGPGKDERAGSGAGAKPGDAPTSDQVMALTLRGLEGDSASVTLSNGKWTGPSSAADGESRPSVFIVPGFLVRWNADGEGPDEVVALAAENSGGSGEYIYLVLAGFEASGVINRATALIGDRVQVVSVTPRGRRLNITVIRTGPEGALCCPDEVADLEYEFNGSSFVKLPEATPGRELTADIMAGTEWMLDATSPGEGDDAGTPANRPITLRYGSGRFDGQSVCNRYFAAVTPGEGPGEISVGAAGSTRMACPDEPANTAEALYLARLGSVVRFGFSACRLMLQYEGEAGTGVLYYRRK